MRFGLKAHHTDLASMRSAASDLDVAFFETVLWDRDLPDHRAAVVDAFSGVETAVHAPFRTPEGHIVDPASENAAVRDASLGVLADALTLAEELGSSFLIVHPGGLAPLGVFQSGGVRKAEAMDRLVDALRELATRGERERILLENMPRWYQAPEGDRACLLGVGYADFIGLRDLVGGTCLDVSHALLAPGGAGNLESFLRRAADQVRHVHLSDGRAPREEGLPLGEGVVDLRRLAGGLLAIDGRRAGRLGVVPEVRDGHLQGGKGFRKALEVFRSFLP